MPAQILGNIPCQTVDCLISAYLGGAGGAVNIALRNNCCLNFVEPKPYRKDAHLPSYVGLLTWTGFSSDIMSTQPPNVPGPATPNLWEKALATLDSDLKSAIASESSGADNIAAQVLRTAEEKRELCLRRRWSYKRANGTEIIIRDVLDKIIGFVQSFVNVGDIAIQFDPKRAALPWAAVRFVLRAVVNDRQVFGGTVESLAIVSRLITQYTAFEMLYFAKPSSISSEIETALVNLYAEVLRHLARAKLYFQMSMTGEETPIVGFDGTNAPIQGVLFDSHSTHRNHGTYTLSKRWNKDLIGSLVSTTPKAIK